MKFIESIFNRKKEKVNMQYESIILELMTRIKKLEDEVAELKAAVAAQNTVANKAVQPEMEEEKGTAPASSGYTKMTDEMIDVCYQYGKRAYETKNNAPFDLADCVAKETGMNRNSAVMYISAVKSMLEGSVYKRAINARATRRYFSLIQKEFGKAGLARALKATNQHIAYRKSFNHPVDSIEAICNEFEDRLG